MSTPRRLRFHRATLGGTSDLAPGSRVIRGLVWLGPEGSQNGRRNSRLLALGRKPRRGRQPILHGRWGWVLFAIAFGLFLLSVPWMLGHDIKEILLQLDEHLGVAFVVAALAIGWYETSAHYQDPIQIARQLSR